MAFSHRSVRRGAQQRLVVHSLWKQRHTGPVGGHNATLSARGSTDGDCCFDSIGGVAGLPEEAMLRANLVDAREKWPAFHALHEVCQCCTQAHRKVKARECCGLPEHARETCAQCSAAVAAQPYPRALCLAIVRAHGEHMLRADNRKEATNIMLASSMFCSVSCVVALRATLLGLPQYYSLRACRCGQGGEEGVGKLSPLGIGITLATREGGRAYFDRPLTRSAASCSTGTKPGEWRRHCSVELLKQ